MIDVLGKIEGFTAVLDLELAACHICCVVKFYLKIIQEQLVDLNKHVLVHPELMQVDSPFGF